MNENIKNLWDATLEEFSKEHQFATIMLPEPLKEKFAELIIRECAIAFEAEVDSWFRVTVKTQRKRYV
jgi:hypothetical protein